MSTREPFPWKYLLLTVTLIVVAALSAMLSHIFYSSPAFQASYGYGYTRPALTKALAERGEGLRLELLTSKGSESPLYDDFASIAPTEPMFGVVVESMRAIGVLFLAFLVARWFYRVPPPWSSSGLLRQAQGKRRINGWSVMWLALFWAFALFVMGYTCLYHFSDAPKRLQTENSELWNFSYTPPIAPAWRVGESKSKEGVVQMPLTVDGARWELKRTDQIWENAGSDWPARAVSYLGDPANVSREAYSDMYEVPYRWYFLYSAAVYWGAALPIFYCMVRGIYRGCRRVLNRVNAARKGEEEQAFRSARLLLRNELHRFLVTCLLISLIGLFEANLGHRTLAFLAQMMVGVCLVFLFSGTVLVLAGLSHYHNAHMAWRQSRPKPEPESQGDRPHEIPTQQENDGSSALSLLRDDPATVALLTLNLSALGVMGDWFVRLIAPLS